jgi:hypothetical protein
MLIIPEAVNGTDNSRLTIDDSRFAVFGYRAKAQGEVMLLVPQAEAWG